jgi:hypothetical protein
MICEECENTGHLGSNCPKIQEDVNYINNNNYRPQENQGWNQQQRPNYQGNYQCNNLTNFNQPPLRDLVLGQGKIMEGLFRKLASNNSRTLKFPFWVLSRKH